MSTHARWYGSQASCRFGTIPFTSTRIMGALSYFPHKRIFHFTADDLESADWVLLWAVLVQIPDKRWVGTPQEVWKEKLLEDDPKLNWDGKLLISMIIREWGVPGDQLSLLVTVLSSPATPCCHSPLSWVSCSTTHRATQEVKSLLRRPAAPSPRQIIEMSRRHYKEWLEIMLDLDIPDQRHSARRSGCSIGYGEGNYDAVSIEGDHYVRCMGRHAPWHASQASCRLGTIPFTSITKTLRKLSAVASRNNVAQDIQCIVRGITAVYIRCKLEALPKTLE
ncbi:hypothetical protein SISSUDRAFT_1117448 [Sistotremastrum suecicum HHB10207 ss-3]|uniref:Uncharacterized protein n=1 Tax=Sistotremastrum suecicum HHB10207 ss-3 TaxID=1314776 RepID=A0A166GNV5_9AGAM|nr:hypothetical protein SISSUDRAFT_1117448 [Sistotremastrum suecicum HHB10207 ss-3]